MTVVIMSVVLPCFTLGAFAIGCLMSNGDIWPTRELKRQLKEMRQRRDVVQDRYDHLHNEYNKLRAVLKEYQEAYLPPPSKFGTIIQEEPDPVVLSKVGTAS